MDRRTQMNGVYIWALEIWQTRPGPDEWDINLGIRNPADMTEPRWVGGNTQVFETR
jgi:hypothetical protein